MPSEREKRRTIAPCSSDSIIAEPLHTQVDSPITTSPQANISDTEFSVSDWWTGGHPDPGRRNDR